VSIYKDYNNIHLQKKLWYDCDKIIGTFRSRTVDAIILCNIFILHRTIVTFILDVFDNKYRSLRPATETKYFNAYTVDAHTYLNIFWV